LLAADASPSRNIPGGWPITMLRPQPSTYSQSGKPFGHFPTQRLVLVGSRTIRRARRRYSQYSLSILALARVSRRIRESRRFTLRIVQLLTNSRRCDEWRRAFRLLAADASPSRNIPDGWPITMLRPQSNTYSQSGKPFGHFPTQRLVLFGSRTIRRTRRRYSLYSLSILRLREFPRHIR
jgi:hypothetical protein